MKKAKETIPGVVICLVIAPIAWVLGQTVRVIGGAVFAIIIGMLIRFFWNLPKVFDAGIKFTSKKILRYAIVLLGFEMNIVRVLETGRDSALVMLFSLAAAFAAAYLVGRLIKIKTNSATLIGVGTGICGGSAIAATAPVIGANDEEIAQSISTIFLFNIIAVFIFPVLGRLLGMSDTGFGIWAGTAVNDTSSVVAAASSWSDDALKLATIVKLTRTLMIVPVTLILALITARTKGAGGKVRITAIFPFFVLGFFVASLIATSGIIPTEVTGFCVQIGKFMIVIAMSAIGLSTNIVSLVKSGKKPIFLGFICWVTVALSSILVLVITKVW